MIEFAGVAKHFGEITALDGVRLTGLTRRKR